MDTRSVRMVSGGKDGIFKVSHLLKRPEIRVSVGIPLRLFPPQRIRLNILAYSMMVLF